MFRSRNTLLHITILGLLSVIILQPHSGYSTYSDTIIPHIATAAILLSLLQSYCIANESNCKAIIALVSLYVVIDYGAIMLYGWLNANTSSLLIFSVQLLNEALLGYALVLRIPLMHYVQRCLPIRYQHAPTFLPFTATTLTLVYLLGTIDILALIDQSYYELQQHSSYFYALTQSLTFNWVWKHYEVLKKFVSFLLLIYLFVLAHLYAQGQHKGLRLGERLTTQAPDTPNEDNTHEQ